MKVSASTFDEPLRQTINGVFQPVGEKVFIQRKRMTLRPNGQRGKAGFVFHNRIAITGRDGRMVDRSSTDGERGRGILVCISKVDRIPIPSNTEAGAGPRSVPRSGCVHVEHEIPVREGLQQGTLGVGQPTVIGGRFGPRGEIARVQGAVRPAEVGALTGRTAVAFATASSVALTARSMPCGSNEVNDAAMAGTPYRPASRAAPIVPL